MLKEALHGTSTLVPQIVLKPLHNRYLIDEPVMPSSKFIALHEDQNFQLQDASILAF